MFAKALPFFFKLSRVKTLPQEASQAKKNHFHGNLRISRCVDIELHIVVLVKLLK